MTTATVIKTGGDSFIAPLKRNTAPALHKLWSATQRQPDDGFVTRLKCHAASELHKLRGMTRRQLAVRALYTIAVVLTAALVVNHGLHMVAGWLGDKSSVNTTTGDADINNLFSNGENQTEKLLGEILVPMGLSSGLAYAYSRKHGSIVLQNTLKVAGVLFLLPGMIL